MPQNYNFRMGTNVLVSNWAYTMLSSDGSRGFVWSPTQSLYFPAAGGPALYGEHYSMGISGGNYVLTDYDTGTVYAFDVASGLLLSATTAGGQVTTNTIVAVSGGYQISQTSRSFTYTQCGSSLTTTETLLYTYYPIDGSPTSGLLQYVTLARTDASTAQIRRLAMTYYGNGDAGGIPGDLMTVALQALEGTQWATISTEYYRYYVQNYNGTSATQPGYQHGLKFVVGPEAFARLSREADPFTAPDEVVANYADYYFEYTAPGPGLNAQRVSKSVTAGGTLPHTFAYVASSFIAGYNNWSLKSTATHADGSQKIAYTNFLAQPMLTDLWATPGVQANGRWINYTVYDLNAARPQYMYSPAAINMGTSPPPYNDASAGLAVQLNTSAGNGLVNVNTYAVVAGLPSSFYYLATQSVQNGTTTGTLVEVNSYTYTVHAGSTSTIVLLASSTNYPDGVTAVTTNYQYTFYTLSGVATVQVNTRSEFPPVIPSGQNGDGIQYQIDTVFDPQGRTSQQFDPYNSASPPSYKPSTQFVYDEPTGAVLQSIRNPYSGTPPDNYEYNLTTDFTVDPLGRTVQTLGPAFNALGQQVRTAAWMIYRDVQHEVWSGSGYAAGSVPAEYVYTLQNPVSITRMDHDGRTIDSIQAVRMPACCFAADGTPERPEPGMFVESPCPLSPSDSFPQVSFVRWSQTLYNDAHDMVAVRRYTAIPAAGPGRVGENYDETRFGYDVMNRQNMVVAAGGTITRTVFDVRDNAVQVFVGTDDAGATDADPTGGRSSGAPTNNNMKNTVTNVFDGGNHVGGNGLLTSTIRHIDGTLANDYSSDFAYDFRDRRTTTTEWIVYGTTAVITFNTLDNNDRVTKTQQYDSSISVGTLIRQSQTSYDWLGRVFQTQRWGVTEGSGTTNILTSNTWFNALNQPVKDLPAGSHAYTKTTYDLANRPVGVYTGYSPGNNDNPWTIGGNDKVFEQTLFTLDAAGNTLLASAFQRHNGDNTTAGPLLPGNARMYYTAFWQDGGGRQVATANYGINNPNPLPLSPPPSSATVLLSQTAYNNRGEGYLSTDPAGMVTRTDTDNAGRTIRTVQNYVPFSPLPGGGCQGEGTCVCATPTTGSDVNVTVLTSYTPDDNVATLTAVNPATGNQTTRYLYGVSLPASAIARNDLLAAVLYPDAADSTDSVQYQYNLQSQVVAMQDQNGTIHAYSFDGMGRPVSDRVQTLGTGVDGSVRRIDTAYEIRGMVKQVTSYADAAGSTVVNRVSLSFNDFEQLLSETQSPGSGGPSLAVGYVYADGSANTIRPTFITYPYSTGSRSVAFIYNSGDDDSLSRASALSFAGVSTLVSYGYFGLGSVASVSYGGPGVSSTLASGASYPGFDLFGRVIDLPWTKSTTGDLAQLQYGYDQASDRTYRQDVKAGGGFDERYTNDGVHRLTAAARGTLASGNTLINSPKLQQSWDLDATGNWGDFSSFDLVTAANSLVQQRVSNTANEITAVGATVGAVWQTPAYDRNGNMTTIPQPASPTSGFAGVFDAWNRLVALSGVATYGYDGLHRRTYSLVSGVYRFFYYSDQWQVLEEYLSTSLIAPDRQYVWGLRYIDELVMRDRGLTGTLERFYALQDANWNVVAICDASGTVQERYAYTAYGVCQFLNASFGILSASAYAWTVLYTGRTLDPESGLYYYRARYYHELLGEFITRDALQSELSPYAYCGNCENVVNGSVGI